MERVLKIDPEFQNKIPPLTEAEYKQLEANILTAGEVFEPITVWNGIIVDGHNRFRIVQEHPEIKWSVREMHFADKWEAFDWMYKNQLGRRNLTDEQRRYLLGKLYEARKHTIAGAPEGNKNASKQLADIRPIEKGKDGTSKVIAEEMKVGKTKVKDSYQYAKGVDAIREVEPKVADAILMGEKKVNMRDIQEIGKASPENRHAMIESVAMGERPARPAKARGIIGNDNASKENRMLAMEVRNIISGMSDDTSMEYTIDHLTEQMSMNAEQFVRSLNNLVTDHADLCEMNRMTVTETLDSIIRQIIAIKRRVNDGTQL